MGYKLFLFNLDLNLSFLKLLFVNRDLRVNVFFNVLLLTELDYFELESKDYMLCSFFYYLK